MTRFKAVIILTVITLTVCVGLLAVDARPTSAQAGAFIRIIHAAPEAPAVDIYFDYAPTPTVRGLAFAAATDFLLVPAKYFSVQVRPAGADAASLPIYATRFTLYANTSVNVVALGTLGAKGSQAFRLGFFLMDRTGLRGATRLNIIHASPDTPTVDLRIDGRTALRTVRFARQPPPSLTFGVGAYDLDVVTSGTIAPALISLKRLALAPDMIHTLVVIGRQSSLRPLILTSRAVLPAVELPPAP
jgi:hypothetical protein